jgi:prepilin-type N-terminal cleavage/methylation domain-containing protein
VTRRSRRGFTIIELLGVLAIVAIIAAVALPKMNLGLLRMDAATRGVAALLARAQRLAVTNQSNVNVVFDVSKQQIRLHEDDDNDNTVGNNERVRAYPLGDGVEYGLGGAPVRVYSPAPLSFTRQQNGLPEVIFRRDGSASENGAIYLTSTNSTSRGATKDARDIEIVMATGRIMWFKYTGAAWQRKF